MYKRQRCEGIIHAFINLFNNRKQAVGDVIVAREGDMRLILTRGTLSIVDSHRAYAYKYKTFVVSIQFVLFCCCCYVRSDVVVFNFHDMVTS